jgi:putative intracellular protease/amidase
VMRTKVLARMAAFAMARPAVQRVAFRTVSQTGIHYRNGPLAVVDGPLPDDAPRAGDRFPWLRVALGNDGAVTDLFERVDDTRWTLVLAGQDAAPAIPWPDGGLDVIVVPGGAGNDAELARAQVPRPSYWLLRPDGHVGLCGTRFDAASLRRYATDTLTMKWPAG